MPAAADKRDTLLVEIRTEELPPGLLEHLSHGFLYNLEKKLIDEKFRNAKPSPRVAAAYVTPRRLVALIEEVCVKSPPREQLRRGPRVDACYDKNGKATAALQGFMRGAGVEDEKDLTRVEEKGREHIAFIAKEPPRELKKELARIVEGALNEITAPRIMRWNDNDHCFVRPVRGVLMMHGKRAIGGKVMGVAADEKGETLGHRVLHSGAVKISAAENYKSEMEETGKVIVDFTEREKKIADRLSPAAFEGSLRLMPDSWRLDAWNALYRETAAMCEFPQPVMGDIPEDLQNLPRHCLEVCLRNHQRIFPLVQNGRCVKFIAFADNKATEQMRRGFENVVTARLRDVVFYLEEDKKLSAEQAHEKLKDIAYHPKLGSQWERVARIEKIADNIAAMMKLPDEERRAVRDAARICKADLSTLMIGEYPELEGYMAAHYFAKNNAPVYKTVDKHNLSVAPKGEGSAPAACLMLADNLEKLAGLLGAGEKADGSKDPHGLRRAAARIAECLMDGDLPLLNLDDMVRVARENFDEKIAADIDENFIGGFIRARAHSIIVGTIAPIGDSGEAAVAAEAVLTLRPQDFSTLIKKTEAVIGFAEKPEAETLAAVNKRINNIFRKSGVEQAAAVDESLFAQDEEKALWKCVRELREKSDAFLKAREFEKTLMLLVQAKKPIEAFFDAVMVNAEDEKTRQNRFALLGELRKLLNTVADLSRLTSL